MSSRNDNDDEERMIDERGDDWFLERGFLNEHHMAHTCDPSLAKVAPVVQLDPDVGSTIHVK
jgi:hypothetical protein